MQAMRKIRGMTLIELMVSMLIGLFLLLGATTVYTQGRQNYRVNEGVARLQENLRFAMDVFEPDVRLAGFWGMHNQGINVAQNGVVVTCEGNDVSNWVFNTAGPGSGPAGLVAINNVQAADAGQVTANCPSAAGGIVVNTDVLEVRRATSQPRNMVGGEVLLQSNVDRSTAFNNGALPADFLDVDPARMRTFGMVVNSWYVANGSNMFPNVPSLRRRTLVGGQMVDEEVIAGVENMQIQLGLDTDGTPDGSVDQYVDPDDPLVNANPVLSVRIWMLIRSADAERGFVDGAIYTPMDDVLPPYQPADGFRRMQVSKTIFLRNAVAG